MRPGFCAGFDSRKDAERGGTEKYSDELRERATRMASNTIEQLPTLLKSTEAYLAGLNAEGLDVAVTDTLVPFVASLIGWGYSEAAMARFLRGLAARIAWAEPTVLYLDDDPALAVPRAIDRDGSGWENWLVPKLGSYPVEPRVRDCETACHYLRYEREVTLRLLSQLPWQVIVVAQTNPPSVTEVRRLACDRLAELYTAT